MEKTLDQGLVLRLATTYPPQILKLYLLLCAGPITATREEIAQLVGYQHGFKRIVPTERQVKYAYDTLREEGLISVRSANKTVTLELV